MLGTRITVEMAKDAVRQRLGEREANFLTTARDAIFSNPASPYRTLFDLAGCSFSDLQQMVRTRGLEPTLRALRDAGVYLTFEEFKGRQPVERHGRHVHVSPELFINPSQPYHFWAESGGSTGSATRLPSNVVRARHSAIYVALRQRAYGIEHVPKALWRGLMPTELNTLLSAVIIDDVPERWFTPQVPFDFRAARRYPFATYAILGLTRLHGVRLPWPELVTLEQAGVIAQWAAETRRRRGGCYISATASMCLRICVAAKAADIDLTGVMFSGAGEPMTAAKAAGITSVGATCRPGYFASELGAIGMGCGNPIEPNEQHLLEDKLAMIQVAREVPGFPQKVDAFNFTTLLPTATTVVVNLELDDFGVVDTRSCGCLFETLGFTRHIRQIRSFRKLTGEAVCLIGSDMERILEEVLPAKFGGSALDYQLSEGEDADGFTRLTLVVSPRIAIPDEASVIRAVYDALAASDASADYARVTWLKSGTLRVVRREPASTKAGKFPSLHRESLPVPVKTSRNADVEQAEEVMR